MNTFKGRVLEKIENGLSVKSIGEVNGKEFWQVNIPEMRKSPYVYVMHEDGHPVKVSEQWDHHLKCHRYRFVGEWLLLGAARDNAKPAQMSLSGSIEWPVEDADYRPAKSRMDRDVLDELILGALKAMAEKGQRFVKATDKEIANAIGAVDRSRVGTRIREMIQTGRLSGRRIRGQGGHYIV